MNTFLIIASVALAVSSAALAQKKPPQPKTKEELAALQAMFGATEPDAQIAAANTVLEKFADSDFKAIALQMIATDYERKNDFAKAVVFGERTLEADPQNYDAMLLLAREYARNTNDTDFDKEDKLKKAEKYASDSITAVAAASKPSAQVTDAQWDAAKKDYNAEAHQVIGQVNIIRKKPEVAAQEFQKSIDMAATPDPATYVRLAQADNLTGKYDEAIAAAEKAMSAPNAVAAVKQFAQAEKVRAMQHKKGPASASTPAAATPASPATPPAAATPQDSSTATPKP